MSLVLPSSGRVTGDFARLHRVPYLAFNPTQVVRKSYKLEACQFGYDSALELGDMDTAPRFARLGLRMLSDLSQGCVSNIFVCATKMFVVEAVVAAVMACLPLCPQVMAATTIPPRSMSCSFKHHGHAVHQPR